MIESERTIGSWGLWLAGVTMAASVTFVGIAPAQECTTLLSLFQQGLSNVEIARSTGWTTNNVAACRRELQRPIIVGPAGAPPVGAAGPAPRNAAGPPPVGAAGPPPVGAAGPPPVGHEVRRLP
jgi:hypothetical protein